VLSGLALAALVLGAVVGGRSGHERRLGQRAPTGTHTPRVSEPLARQAGQLLLISFKGVTAPGYVLRALHQGRVAGVILFGGNAPTAASTRALTAQLQRAAGGDAIVCLDQEGGASRTLAFAPSAVGQAGQATAAAAGAAAAQTARALRAAGTRAQLAGDLRPYAVGAPLVMVGHARYPALDPAAIASQSRAIVTGLLRGRLGFEGVAMTDSLEAQAVRATGGGVGAAAVRSVSAGIDLLLTTGPGSFLPVRDALLARARRDPAFRARVAASAARVEALRRGLLPH
jgi:beta-N-acetylhexosaminidase